MITEFERRICLQALAAHGVPAGSLVHDSQSDCEVQVTTEFDIHDTKGILVLVSAWNREYWAKPEWLKPLQSDVQFVEVKGE